MGNKIVIHPLNFMFGKPKNEIEWAAHHALNTYYREHLEEAELKEIPRKPLKFTLDERGGYRIEEV